MSHRRKDRSRVGAGIAGDGGKVSLSEPAGDVGKGPKEEPGEPGQGQMGRAQRQACGELVA